MKKHKFLFLFLALLTFNCFAGGIKGPLISDEALNALLIGIIMIHLGCIAAFVTRNTVLRVLFGVLYLPVLIVPLLLSVLSAFFLILFIPVSVFYYFTIIRKRK